jgi:nucleotide-binding universal stress UspA family protein
MVNKILVPIGFDLADQATRGCARAMARRANATLELITVCEGDDVELAERHLASIVEDGEPATTTRVVVGTDVEGELVGEAISNRDALLCLSSTAKGSFVESLLGSISEDLARDAGLPVVLVGPMATRRIEDGVNGILLVPLDGTLTGEAILPHAFAIATEFALQVTLVQVIDQHDVPVGLTIEESNYLHNVADEWHDVAGGINWEVLHGRNVGKAIADFIERTENVVLVAMATRGVPVAGRLYYPSTTFSLLRHSAAPVAVLHPVPVSSGATP